MDFNTIFKDILDYTTGMNLLEATGLIFGLLAVYYLIKENILTWPAGIIYTFTSLVIFYEAKLYADLLLHVFFLFMNIYGWYYWVYGKKKGESEVPVTTSSVKVLVSISLVSVVAIALLGYLLTDFTDASLPYWDSTTTILSLSGMWLTAKKKIENWYFWFIVDVLATGIYMYKGIYFYGALYLVYIGMAVSGYLEWKKTMKKQAVFD